MSAGSCIWVAFARGRVDRDRLLTRLTTVERNLEERQDKRTNYSRDDFIAKVWEWKAESGGTITHHHAVGRDHRPWYDAQRPEPFASALRAVKRELDPAGMLNPGVLLD